MKTILYILSIIVLFSSCNRAFEKAMKSSDPAVIVPLAKQMLEKEKYDNANRLFEHSVRYVYGTDYARDVAYYGAQANYGFKNYPLAASQFKTFALNFPKDSMAEEARYMGAYCYYEGSLDYNLDPRNTKKAIDELQSYINEYPNSTRIDDSNKLINELHSKLEKKAFENAKTLFTIAQYRASTIAFDNVLNDYPDTHLKEETLWFGLQSKANYAFDSREDVKKDRLNDAMTAYKILKKAYPESEYLKDADKIVSKFDKEYESVEKYEELVKNYKSKN